MDIIPEITIYDKLYIKKEYASKEELLSMFSYRLDESYATSFAETTEYYTLAVGCLKKLKYKILIDKRIDLKLSYPITFRAKLHAAQDRTLSKFYIDSVISSGILKARCGWGKSFWGVKLICEDSRPTIILVHTKLLMDQWIALFKEFTDYDPGIIGDGIFQPKDITIGLYISVNNKLNEIKDRFSRVIVDEVHRCGSDLFSETLNGLPAKYKNGMSATPTRRDGKHVLFNDYFTEVFIEAEEYRNLTKPFVEIKKVPFKFECINPTRDWAKALSKVFANQQYLEELAEDTKTLMSDGRTCLLLAPRVEALETLQKMIPRSVTLTGKLTKGRDELLAKIGPEYNCVLSTTIFDEGLSCHILDTLITSAPNGKNYGLLEQRIGRIQREHPDKQPPLIRSYWLQNHILAKQQNIEYLWYISQKFGVKYL